VRRKEPPNRARLEVKMAERMHAVIEGYVQGVGFRAFVVEQAQFCGVRGWVRNRWDTSVEVCAEGERDKLERLLTALRRGPTAAHVEDVTVEWQIATGDFADFRMISSL
jgi:acylphosphatase